MIRAASHALLLALVLLGTAAGCAAGRGEGMRPWWSEESGPEPGLSEVLPGAPADWRFQGSPKQTSYRIEHNDAVGRGVLVCTDPAHLAISGRTPYEGEVEISCLAQLSAQAGSRIVINPCKDPSDPKSPGLPVQLYAQSQDIIQVSCPALPGNRFRHSAPELAGFSAEQSTASFQYELRAYQQVLPTWDPKVRAALEKDMSELPLAADKWVQVRFLLGKDWARILVDDRLILDHQSKDLKTSGMVSFDLWPGARLAGVSVRPLALTGSLYEPLPLDGCVRDRALADGAAVSADSLPFGKTVTVDGIPFAFADPQLTGRADHVDVGRSFLREANMEGHNPVRSELHRFADPFQVDPARIRFRAPNGRYNAMYLIAGFDGEEDSIPIVSAQFFRVDAGFSMVFETEVPSIYEKEAAARPLPVKLEDGRTVRLWLVKMPLEPGMLSSFADMGWLDFELTKKVHQYRSYPDPIHYDWHGGGMPSGVHVYAVTLQRPEVHMEVLPAVFGHVWEAQTPSYTVKLDNRAGEAREVTVTVDTRSDDGEETTHQDSKASVPPGRSVPLRVSIPVKKNGYHDLVVSMDCGGTRWTERLSLVKLARNTRPDEWTGKGPLFGYWSYYGGHYTPPKEEHVRLMRMAGARAPTYPGNAWPITPQWSWAGDEPVDPKKYDEYKKQTVGLIIQHQGENPKLLTFFPEPHISMRLTTGNLPSYWGEPDYVLDEAEQRNLRVFFNTAKAAAEACRQKWPGVRILIPWGDPLFVVPLLRAGFPKELIDGSGLDVPGFERLPEQQLHQISIHRLYTLREEFRKAGIEKPCLAFVEGIFVPTEPGACTWGEQADYHDRWALISMAYGVNEFYSGWFAFDCGNYYGTEHYGGCGIQRRIPYCNPKPAYAHYATMTRMLDSAKFEKWLPTGSLSTYCLKFDKPQEKGGPVHVLWTLRGNRPVTLALKADATLTVTDANDNAAPSQSKDRTVTVMTSPSVIYVHGVAELESVKVGAPDNSDSVEWARTRNRKTWQTGPLARGPEVAHEMVVASPGDGTWQLDEHRDDYLEVYETNNFDTVRYRGKMAVSLAQNPEHSPALAVKLLAQDKERKLMPWYTVLRPAKPVVIPGKSLALGLWVKGACDWGRVVYCLSDANGEMWLSIGTKDQWNCDDVHSWSSFNFDGWRYLRFEMPSHLPYDSFREYGTTWWRYAGGKPKGIGVVDLPLTLEKIIVERRTHILYVNDIQPTGAQDNDVLLGELTAEYESAWHATKEAVAQSRIRMPLPETPQILPNPIETMAAENTLPPVKLTGVRDPDWGYDGTRCHVEFDQAEGAAGYQVWVAAHPDGRGAVQMANIKQSGELVQGLSPGIKLYLWVTYSREEGQGADKKVLTSKPSNVLEVLLVDAFGMK